MNTTNNEQETHTGAPQSATPTSIILDTNASDCDGMYTGHVLRTIEGAGLGEQQTIKSYDGRTKIATLHGTWIAVPNTTSVYAIIDPEPVGFGVLTKTNNRPKRHIGILQDVTPTTLDKMLINLNINPDINAEFESLKDIHELTLSDALKIGMKEVIHRVQSPQEIQRRINRKQDEIFGLYSQLHRATEAQKHSGENTDFRWDQDGRI